MMKTKIKVTSHSLIIVLLLLFSFSFSNIEAKTKKLKPRLSVTYNKEGETHFLQITGKYKEDKEFKMAKGLNLKIYQITDNDSLVLIGNGILNKAGKLNFNVASVFNNPQDEYQFEVDFEGTEKLQEASSSLTVIPVFLTSELLKDEDQYSIKAVLTDKDQNPIVGQELKVQLQRLFAPLPVNNEIQFTDENGMIIVPIENIMPGINGELNYEVVIKDSEEYGTVKSMINTKIGSVIKDLSTFDQRTMWSPPRMAPWADLIIPNLLIFGIWLTIIILVINLFKISKN